MKIELDCIHTRPCLEYTPYPLSILPALNTWSEATLLVYLFGESGDVGGGLHLPCLFWVYRKADFPFLRIV